MSEVVGEGVVRIRTTVSGDSSAKLKKQGEKAGHDYSDGISKAVKGITSGFSEAGERMSKVLNIAGYIGPALLSAGAALSSAAAGGVALLGAIGPGAAAGAAAYVGVLGAVKTAGLATQFALGGITQALAGQKGAMKALTPEGRDLVHTLRDLKPEVTQIRAAVQKGLFPGLQQAASQLSRSYLPLVTHAASLTGDALGSLATAGTNMVATGPWRRDFGTLAQANAHNIANFGFAGLNLADALRSLLVTAAPVTNAFAEWSVGATKAVDSWVQAKRATGELDTFWSHAAKTGALLGHILGDLGGAVANVFSIGAEGAGKGMLRNVEQITARFRDWTGSANGAKVISQWFENGRKNLGAMSRLIGTVFGGMQTIGTGSLLAPLIDQITKQVIPPLMEFLHNASDSGALEALVSAVASVVQVFAGLSASNSSMTAFAVTLGALAKAFGWLMQNVPGASKALGVFFVAAGAMQAVNLVGLGGVVKSLGGLMLTLAERLLGVTAATEANTVATTENAAASGISRVASIAAAAASKAWAAAQWLLNGALDGNPIALIIIGVAALVAGIILAYKHSETFREVIGNLGAAFTWLYEHAVKPVLGFLLDHWKLIAVVVATLIGGPIIGALVLLATHFGIIKGAVHVLGAAFTWLWNNAFEPALKFIVNGLAILIDVWGHMLSALGKIPGFGWAKDAGKALQDAADKARGVADAINKIPNHKAVHIDLITTTDKSGVVHSSGGGHVPAMADGGVVRARPGGTLVRVGEAGQDEAVVPLGRDPRTAGTGAGIYVAGDYVVQAHNYDDLTQKQRRQVQVAAFAGRQPVGASR